MTPAQIALDQFVRRRAWAARSGEPVAEQEAKLRPWAALALRAGADTARLPPDVHAAVEAYRRHPMPDRTARACVADDLCALPFALAVLARARDAAIDATPERPGADAPDALKRRFAQAEQLSQLSAYLGAPGYRCASLGVEPKRQAA